MHVIISNIEMTRADTEHSFHEISSIQFHNTVSDKISRQFATEWSHWPLIMSLWGMINNHFPQKFLQRKKFIDGSLQFDGFAGFYFINFNTFLFVWQLKQVPVYRKHEAIGTWCTYYYCWESDKTNVSAVWSFLDLNKNKHLLLLQWFQDC